MEWKVRHEQLREKGRERKERCEREVEKGKRERERERERGCRKNKWLL